MAAVVTWDELALFGLLFSYLFAVLVYMLSYVFTSEVMRAWSKVEIQSVILTLILFASIRALAAQGFVSGSEGYIKQASDYLKTLYDDAIYCQVSMIKSANLLSLLSSFSISLSIAAIADIKSKYSGQQSQPQDTEKQAEGNTNSGESPSGISNSLSGGISFAPFLQPILSSVATVYSYFFIPFGMLKFHLILMQEFIIKHGVKILLPLGVFLRAFKFSRNAGNLVIALFLALYFVLPAMYLFNKGLMIETMGLKEDKLNVCKSYDPSIIDEFIGPVMAKFVPRNLYDQNKPFHEYILGTEISYGGSDLAKIFLRVGIEAMLLPFISIIVTLGIAREFARVLGSEVDFSQLVRLV